MNKYLVHRILIPFLLGLILVSIVGGAVLTRQSASLALKDLAQKKRQALQAGLEEEWSTKSVKIGDKVMKFDYRTFGEKPAAGWDFYISMHGGGGAPAHVNESQWRNQIRLYQPPNSIYLAPRAPTNTWNLWHQSHIDGFFERLILGAVMVKGINLDRVYIMGYSAGGDGVYQLAPRMADRLAAASMMAGHPNNASPLGLRNIGFTIHVGELDGGYKRNKVAMDWRMKLAALRKGDPNGYAHKVKLHKGMGHWMKLRDAEAIDWMSMFTRNPVPKRVVWKQAGVTKPAFYWLAAPKDHVKAGASVIAEREGQVIRILEAHGTEKLTVLLDDRMLDLDKEVTISRDGQILFRGRVERKLETLSRTLNERHDPRLSFSAEVTVDI
ncbi:MAG: alpha/beta hydrolase [Opitutae bacterium]|nr:alpha/beta hydrolase [Opitutae bacterium]MBT7854445.1 alpha/beta hydrolase [Opitutae bacterium]